MLTVLRSISLMNDILKFVGSYDNHINVLLIFCALEFGESFVPASGCPLNRHKRLHLNQYRYM